MTLRTIIENLPAHPVFGPQGYLDHPVGVIVAGDLMSDMLLSVYSDALLVTSLATEQAVRTADMIGACAILLVNDKLPHPQMKALAEECGIAVLATPQPMYEACTALAFLKNCHEDKL